MASLKFKMFFAKKNNSSQIINSFNPLRDGLQNCFDYKLCNTILHIIVSPGITVFTWMDAK